MGKYSPIYPAALTSWCSIPSKRQRAPALHIRIREQIVKTGTLQSSHPILTNNRITQEQMTIPNLPISITLNKSKHRESPIGGDLSNLQKHVTNQAKLLIWPFPSIFA
jgi:hypothetical protein